MKKPIDIQSIKQRFGIIGNSPLLNNALERAVQVAATDMNVLITGESGSGKESFSKIIHQLSTRKHAGFMAVNCGAIPEGTIDSELFGHEKGAYTDAKDARKGFFEVTDKGTIFLDEIGEMPLGTQSRLLRVLENGEFIKVGSSKVQKTDVRVVAATNVDLKEAVENKKFREDLYYRLSTVPIYVPPLRERGDKDIVLLFKKFASDFSERYGSVPISLLPDAAEVLVKYRFPGNIRQLKNIVDQMSLFEQNEIEAQTLLSYLPHASKSNLPALIHKPASDGSGAINQDILYQIIIDMRKDLVEMKKLIYELVQSGQFDAKALLKEHGDLFDEVEKEQITQYLPEALDKIIHIDQTEEGTEDIIHETQDESLSLEEKEKELIVKALTKNKNKRKYAAQDLGISERTLYRKIKQYDLDGKKW